MSEQPEKQQASKKDKRQFIILIVLLGVMLGIAIILSPYFVHLADEQSREQLINQIRSKGLWGVFILLGLQILQVIVALIPGELIEVVSGILYGTLGGYLICTIGVLLSSMMVFFAVRKLGSKFVTSIVPQEKLTKFKFLHDVQKLELIIFILFFIPGTPKDILTYVIPLTKIKPSHFFLISTLARIPSILSSTYAGSSLGKGKFLRTLIIFLITGAVGILGILFHDRILTCFHHRKRNDNA